MANYVGTVRTNYFRVTDEKKYAELFSRLCSEDNIYDFSRREEDGTIMHGFGCNNWISMMSDEDEMCSLNPFFFAMQDILPEDDAFAIIEIGQEKLQYVDGFATVVTKHGIRHMNALNWITQTAREMLQDPDYESQLDS